MKVGIDGTLIGSWTPVGNEKQILDIGTGCGLISLMLAQRSNSDIIGIDIDGDAISQATENIKNSPWSDRIKVQEISLQQFAETTLQLFDLIVSNPPFFINSTKTPTESRTTARHTDTLTHEELIENAIKLLNPEGRICIILPVNEGLQCLDFAQKKGLYCTNEVTVFPKPNGVAKRILLEFSLLPAPKVIKKLVIESEVRHQYSPEFAELAKDFYLKL